MSRPICEGRRKDGQPCRAPQLPDSRLCWSHDPRQAEQAARAWSEGASKGGQLKALQGRRQKLDTPAALVRFVAGVVQDVIGGQVEPDVARTALYGVSIQQRLIETSDLEARLSALEQATRLGGRRR